MEVIEDAYSSRRTNQVDMKKLLQGMPYVIDLQNMVQIRLDTKFERDVRREKIVGSYATVKDSGNEPERTRIMEMGNERE